MDSDIILPLHWSNLKHKGNQFRHHANEGEPATQKRFVSGECGFPGTDLFRYHYYEEAIDRQWVKHSTG